MLRQLGFGVFALALMLGISMLGISRADASRPIPYFAGTEGVSIYCSPSTRPALDMNALCRTVSEMVSAYLGIEVGVGPSTLRDPNVMHVVINAFPTSSPRASAAKAEGGGPVGSTIITISFYRAAHVNPLLAGPAPFLLESKPVGEDLSGREAIGVTAKQILARIRGYLSPPAAARPPEPRRID
jgi:hypothetical protein